MAKKILSVLVAVLLVASMATMAIGTASAASRHSAAVQFIGSVRGM